jgi:hypothetical protein
MRYVGPAEQNTTQPCDLTLLPNLLGTLRCTNYIELMSWSAMWWLAAVGWLAWLR